MGGKGTGIRDGFAAVLGASQEKQEQRGFAQVQAAAVSVFLQNGLRW